MDGSQTTYLINLKKEKNYLKENYIYIYIYYNVKCHKLEHKKNAISLCAEGMLNLEFFYGLRAFAFHVLVTFVEKVHSPKLEKVHALGRQLINLLLLVRKNFFVVII